MLIKQIVLDGITAGTITLVFRRWKRPTVKPGGTLLTKAGLLAIEAVDKVTLKSITDEQAQSAGFDSREALVKVLKTREGQCYRIQLSLKGPDPRLALRAKLITDKAEMLALNRALEKVDKNSRGEPWTFQFLELIADNPGKLAAEIAQSIDLEKKPFKARVRKLKELGLTISLKQGYELSPRGRSYVGRRRQARDAPDALVDLSLP